MKTICFSDEQYIETVTILQEERDRAIEDIEQLLKELRKIPGDPDRIRGPEFLNLGKRIRYQQEELDRILNILDSLSNCEIIIQDQTIQMFNQVLN
ncbi:hypothetical protein ACFLTA_02500 [Bacteroidota bacterium]